MEKIEGRSIPNELKRRSSGASIEELEQPSQVGFQPVHVATRFEDSD